MRKGLLSAETPPMVILNLNSPEELGIEAAKRMLVNVRALAVTERGKSVLQTALGITIFVAHSTRETSTLSRQLSF